MLSKILFFISGHQLRVAAFIHLPHGLFLIFLVQRNGSGPQNSFLVFVSDFEVHLYQLFA